jgi:anti-anti-sigma regulatory factor
MAKNFRMITSEQADRTVQIQLKGDFDGTSAHELANMLTGFGSSFAHVAIDTDGLRTLHAFGLNLFSAKLKMLGRTPARIMFYGKFKNNFVEE